ncbi:hypothetical protein BST61_g11491 [Cercospora zeina]
MAAPDAQRCIVVLLPPVDQRPRSNAHLEWSVVRLSDNNQSLAGMSIDVYGSEPSEHIRRRTLQELAVFPLDELNAFQGVPVTAYRTRPFPQLLDEALLDQDERSMKSLLCCVAVATSCLVGCPDGIPSSMSGWAWAGAIATAMLELERGRLSTSCRAVDLPPMQKLQEKNIVSSSTLEGASGLKKYRDEMHTCVEYRRILVDYTNDLLALRALARRRENLPLCTDPNASAALERKIEKTRALQTEYQKGDVTYESLQAAIDELENQKAALFQRPGSEILRDIVRWVDLSRGDCDEEIQGAKERLGEMVQEIRQLLSDAERFVQ